MSVDSEIVYSVLFVYALIVISPGPNFVLVCKYALNSSKPLAFAVTMGLAVAATFYATLAMFGIGALINSHPYFDVTVSLLGGAFLAYIGIAGIARSHKTRRANTCITDIEQDIAISMRLFNKGWLSALQLGYLTNLLNPKAIAFFVSLYGPIVASASLTTKGLILTIGFMLEVSWYGLIIAFLSRDSVRTIYASYAFVFDFILGAILILLGVLIFLRPFA